MPTVTDLTSSGTTPIPVSWVHHIDGRFCVGHWSWLCGRGQGKCQEEFFSALVALVGGDCHVDS